MTWDIWKGEQVGGSIEDQFRFVCVDEQAPALRAYDAGFWLELIETWDERMARTEATFALLDIKIADAVDDMAGSRWRRSVPK